MSHGTVWFRNDLRLQDNPAWGSATSTHERVTALFVIDPLLWKSAPEGRRSRLLDHLAALDVGLAAHGGRLRVERGAPEQVVPAVAAGGRVYWNSDVTPYAIRRDAAVEELVDSEVHQGRWTVPVGSVLTNDGGPYRVFTPFFRRWQERVREPWPDPGEARLDDFTGVGLSGGDPSNAGERAARVRIEAFLERVDRYDDLRDIPAVEGTSRLSEDLKFGTISPRVVENAVGTYTPGRAGFVRQLAWREFCAQLLRAYPHMLRSELRDQYAGIAWQSDPSAIESWATGMTGYPIVDAGMRQLLAEGWMHNRARMLTASFLVKDLLCDWRTGERHFAALLHDYDPAQNVANWQWVAGTGADAAPYFRVFNPVTQGRRFDRNGDYVRRWVPELGRIEGDAIHAPWDLSASELEAAGVLLGETYPHRIVDHAEARVEAIAAYESARAGSD